MSLYNRFSDVMRSHGPFVQRMEKMRQERILDWIQPFMRNQSAVRVLEVGVGIGLFAAACRRRGWSYIGIDRNEKMAHELGREVPPLPTDVEPGSFDLAYASFIFEHLADGTHGFEFVGELSRALMPEGLLVLVVPDALKLGMEFWNLDYTHRYPTSDRNVSQIMLECGLQIERIVRYRGAGWIGWRYWLVRIAGWFYSYRFWQALLQNKDFPYSVYQYLKQDVLVFICRNP